MECRRFQEEVDDGVYLLFITEREETNKRLNNLLYFPLFPNIPLFQKTNLIRSLLTIFKGQSFASRVPPWITLSFLLFFGWENAKAY
jgi:hypothetical protein